MADQILQQVREALEGQIDFEGQRLAEFLATVLLSIVGVRTLFIKSVSPPNACLGGCIYLRIFSPRYKACSHYRIGWNASYVSSHCTAMAFLQSTPC